jgi:hypothetical protein
MIRGKKMASANNPQPKSSQIQFGKLPTAPILNGALVGLPRAALATYLVLVSASRDWQASVSVDRIGESAGLSRRGVQLALRRLEQDKLIKALGTNGAGVPVYLLESGGMFLVISERKTPPTSDGTAQNNVARGADIEPKGRNELCAHTEDLTENRAEADTAAGFCDVLRDAGIGEPTRSRLARELAVARVTADSVARVLTSRASGSPGVTILKLRDLCESSERSATQQQAQREREAAESQRVAEEVQARETLRRDAERDQSERDAYLAKAGRERVAAAARAVAARNPIFSGLDQSTHVAYRAAIARHLRDHRAMDHNS